GAGSASRIKCYRGDRDRARYGGSEPREDAGWSCGWTGPVADWPYFGVRRSTLGRGATLALYCAGGEAGDEFTLQEEEEAHDGGDGDQGAGHDEAVVCAVEAAEVVDRNRERESLGFLQD